MTRGWAARAAIALVLCISLGAECSKPDWVKELEHAVDVAVPELEKALDDLAKDLPAAVDKLDQVTADRVRELDATLRDAVDGLNHVLAENQRRLDAALAARVRQLTKIATALAADVRGVARGLTTRISASVTLLLAETRAAAQRVIADLGAQVARVQTEGDRVVADVYSQGLDLTVRIVGVVLLAIGAIGAGLIFVTRVKRRTRAALVAQGVGAAVVLAAGAGLVLSSGLRGTLVRVEPVIVDHRDCAAALADATTYVGVHAQGVSPEAVAEASALMPRIASCLVMAGSSELFELAQARLAAVRRLLGIARPCIASSECAGGQTCDVASGACVRRCATNPDCLQGEVCHPAQHACAPPCAGSCPGGAVCTSGVCVPSTTGTGTLVIGGGRNWARLRGCADDDRCLRILDHTMRVQP